MSICFTSKRKFNLCLHFSIFKGESVRRPVSLSAVRRALNPASSHCYIVTPRKRPTQSLISVARWTTETILIPTSSSVLHLLEGMILWQERERIRISGKTSNCSLSVSHGFWVKRHSTSQSILQDNFQIRHFTQDVFRSLILSQLYSVLKYPFNEIFTLESFLRQLLFILLDNNCFEVVLLLLEGIFWLLYHLWFRTKDLPVVFVKLVLYYDFVMFVLINSDALYYCRDHHHDLVTITNMDDQRWIQKKVKNASTDYVWMGLSYACTLDFWFWVSDDVVSYKNWASGEPMDDCDMSGAMETGGKHQWFKKKDTEKFNFICSKN
uniref:C-type lectin domain-containing protein n=1 Tax=Poecilia reticulata TaxID=8081 RepID=A0A3P9NNN7_POERE